jgi:penicillin-binding protein 1B
MYDTLASGGYRTPLRAIREVLTARGEPLTRYPLSVEKVIDAPSMYLLNTALQNVVRNGTGRGVYRRLPESLVIAGKTGTSDDLRDSWFAGYTGDKLGVVWVGMDNNDPTGLTGATGAMRVWADIFRNIGAHSPIDSPPASIKMVKIDRESYLRADDDCTNTVELPFIDGSAPQQPAPCAGGTVAGDAGNEESEHDADTDSGFFGRLFGGQ